MNFIKISRDSSKHFQATNYYSRLIKNVAHDFLVCYVCTTLLVNDKTESCGLKIYE